MNDYEKFCQVLDDLGIEYSTVLGDKFTDRLQVRMTWDKVFGVGVKSIDWNFSAEGQFLWVE